MRAKWSAPIRKYWKISEQMMRREKGIPTSWCTPYGYQLNQQGNKFEATEDAKWVKLIYQWYLAGVSTNEIARRLEFLEVARPNERLNRKLHEGDDPTYNKWHPSTVLRILNSSAYIGELVSYWNFREYLDDSYPEFLQEFEWMYNIGRIDFSDPRVPAGTRERWEESVNHELWSEFEEKMGQPNISEMMDASTSVLADMDLDGGLIGIGDTMNSYWADKYGYVKKFEQYVKEWIESVDTSDITPKRRALIESTDYFLNFNYTDLLENVYKIENVLHIHGGVASVTDRDPIMGHCNYKDIEDHCRWAEESDEKFDEGEASIHRAVVNYLKSIYKDTELIIGLHKAFWDKLKNVDKVVTIGWSAGNADLPYLRKIRESVSKNTKWYAYFYDDKAYKALNAAMIEGDIEGKFEVNYISTDEFWD